MILQKITYCPQRYDFRSIIVLVWLQDNANRIIPFVGKWKGHSITKRSGVYGATIAEADTIVVLEIDDKDQLIQVCSNCYLNLEF